MSLHYILDGYNIIKQSSFFSSKSLSEARIGLINFIEENMPCGSKNNSVTIVFDGRPDISFPSNKTSNFIAIIFTKGESADILIKKIVEEDPNPKRLVVVTDDKDIRFSIRSCGAKFLSTKDFILQGRPKVKISNKTDSTKMDLTEKQLNTITKELEKIWLG